MDYSKRTSSDDLYKLCEKLDIKDVIVCRKGELKKNMKDNKYTNYIINLDDIGGGTHWVAKNSKKKVYFDSYAELPPVEIPKNYKLSSQKKELQALEATDCGGLCCLWLYYINYKNNKEYYKLFKDVYK